MSASSRMTAADLPPSSRVQRAIRSPQIEGILPPAAFDPVKVILSPRGSRTSSSETSRSAVSTLRTPAGRPAGSAASAIRDPSPGASGDDLSTTVQPASSAGATLLLISPIGAFQGMIAPTTPTGSPAIQPQLPTPGLGRRSNREGPAPA